MDLVCGVLRQRLARQMAKEKIALLEPYKQTEKEGKRDKLLGGMPWLIIS